LPLNVQNVNVHLVDRGTGQAILFLHGNPDSADMWDGVISRLSSRFRCLAPDLPGFGRSTGSVDFDCSLDNMAAFVDGLILAAGITEPVNLVVHDFGGPYGLAWAIKHPDKIRRIAVTNTLFFSDYRWHFWARVWRTPCLGELSVLLMNRWIFGWELRRGSPTLSQEHILRSYGHVTPTMQRMVLRLYRATDPENFRGWEEKLLGLTRRIPTLVLWGDRDPYIPIEFADRFGTENIKHFPDSGHWLPVEAPDEVSDQLSLFLT
jgi:pimeloyl-ACP methyl ester carboxylesterase